MLAPWSPCRGEGRPPQVSIAICPDFHKLNSLYSRLVRISSAAPGSSPRTATLKPLGNCLFLSSNHEVPAPDPPAAFRFIRRTIKKKYHNSVTEILLLPAHELNTLEEYKLPDHRLSGLLTEIATTEPTKSAANIFFASSAMHKSQQPDRHSPAQPWLLIS